MSVRSVAFLLLVVLALILPAAFPVQAHRSGCHRWHSCPSDRGTYECGDLGHCSGCPDNTYCELGKPRLKPQKQTQAEPPKPQTPPKTPGKQ
jgi:hypothetical protein